MGHSDGHAEEGMGCSLEPHHGGDTWFPGEHLGKVSGWFADTFDPMWNRVTGAIATAWSNVWDGLVNTVSRCSTGYGT